jgi:hypothetical protein
VSLTWIGNPSTVVSIVESTNASYIQLARARAVFA